MKKVTDFVTAELRQNPMARKSDAVLVRGVLKRMGVDVSLPFDNLLELGICSKVETISRCRRKVQESHPELCDEQVKEWRKENERLWRDFMKGECRQP